MSDEIDFPRGGKKHIHEEPEHGKKRLRDADNVSRRIFSKTQILKLHF